MKAHLLFVIGLIVFPFFSCNENLLTNSDNVIPTQSTDSLFIDLNTLPKYTKYDSLRIQGNINNYKFIICEGGESKVKTRIDDSTFSFWIVFKKNTLNKLIIYAEDEYDRRSDSAYFFVIHDNIPPKILQSSIQQNEKSVPLDKKLEFEFDSSINSIMAYYNLTSIPSDFTYEFLDNSKRVKINSADFFLGFEYPLRIMATDSANNILDSTIIFRTYYDKLAVPNVSASLGKMFFSSDGNTLYITQSNPDALLIYDVSTWSLKKAISIDFLIKDAAYNQYNGNIYLASFEQARVVSLDPNSEVIINNIYLLNTGNPVYTPKHPISIAFADNGIGLVTALPLISSGPQSVQVIDSRFNDSIYVHPFYAPETFNYFKVIAFDNYQSLSLIDVQGNTAVSIFNPFTNSFHQFYITQSHHKPLGHLKSNRFSIYGSEGIFLINSSGNTIGHSFPFSAYEYLFDFTYLINEDNIIYYLDYNKKLAVLDIAQNTKLDEAQMLDYSSNLVVTLDGKFIIIYQPPTILLIEPSTFR